MYESISKLIAFAFTFNFNILVMLILPSVACMHYSPSAPTDYENEFELYFHLIIPFFAFFNSCNGCVIRAMYCYLPRETQVILGVLMATLQLAR